MKILLLSYSPSSSKPVAYEEEEDILKKIGKHRLPKNTMSPINCLVNEILQNIFFVLSRR